MILGDVVVGLSIGSAYALLAIAVVLVYSSTRALAICLGEIGAFGLYLGLHWSKVGVPIFGWHLNPLGSAIVAVLAGAVLGLAVERVVMRPLVGREPLDALVASLALALLLALLEFRLYGLDPGVARSPLGDASVVVFGSTLTAARIGALVLAAAVSAGLFVFLNRTGFGRATRATVSDPTVARLLGVRVNRVYMFSWGVAGGLCGAAASLLAPIAATLTPFSLTSFLLRALAGAVIGGLASLRGAVLGSLLVGVVEGVVSPRYGSMYSSLVIFLLVLGVLLLRGSGVAASVKALLPRVTRVAH